MVDAVIRWCLKNAFLVMLGVAVLLAGGYYALINTPVDAIPDIGEKQVIVFADWPGRSPQDVDDQVTYPLTISLTGTPGVKTIRSHVRLRLLDGLRHLQGRGGLLLGALARAGAHERRRSSGCPTGVVPVLGPDATALGQVYLVHRGGARASTSPNCARIQDWYRALPTQGGRGRLAKSPASAAS